MNRDTLAAQRLVLRGAANASPLALYAGPLRHQAAEIERVLRAANQAEGDDIEVDDLEFVVAGALSPGVRLYWPNLGPGTLLRCSYTGRDVTGLWVEFDGGPPEWANVNGSASPVLVLRPQPDPPEHPALEA